MPDQSVIDLPPGDGTVSAAALPASSTTGEKEDTQAPSTFQTWTRRDHVSISGPAVRVGWRRHGENWWFRGFLHYPYEIEGNGNADSYKAGFRKYFNTAQNTLHQFSILSAVQ